MNERPLVSPGLIVGGLILTAGIILLLDRQGIIDAGQIFQFWPLAVIGLGIARLLNPSTGGSRVSGIFIILAGAAIELNKLGYIRFTLGQIWPLILVAIGGALLWRAIEDRREPVAPAQAAAPFSDTPPLPGRGSSIHRFVAFGGIELVSDVKDFVGGEIMATFGGAEVDLRQADIAGDTAVLNISAMFGGIELKVPDNWSVSFHGLPIFGGYVDKTRHPREDGPAKPKRLVVRGFAMFGGVEIKN